MAIVAEAKRSIDIKDVGFKAKQDVSFERIERTYSKSLRFCTKHKSETVNFGNKPLHLLSISANRYEFKDDCGQKGPGITFCRSVKEVGDTNSTSGAKVPDQKPQSQTVENKKPCNGVGFPLKSSALFTSTELQPLCVDGLEFHCNPGMFANADDYVDVFITYGTGKEGEPDLCATGKAQTETNRSNQPSDDTDSPILNVPDADANAGKPSSSK